MQFKLLLFQIHLVHACNTRILDTIATFTGMCQNRNGGFPFALPSNDLARVTSANRDPHTSPLTHQPHKKELILNGPQKASFKPAKKGTAASVFAGPRLSGLPAASQAHGPNPLGFGRGNKPTDKCVCVCVPVHVCWWLFEVWLCFVAQEWPGFVEGAHSCFGNDEPPPIPPLISGEHMGRQGRHLRARGFGKQPFRGYWPSVLLYVTVQDMAVSKLPTNPSMGQFRTGSSRNMQNLDSGQMPAHLEPSAKTRCSPPPSINSQSGNHVIVTAHWQKTVK